MAPMTFSYVSRIPAPAGVIFAWHERPGAFERLTPPWRSVRVLARGGGIREGGYVELALRIGHVPVRWELRHQDYIAGRQFRDVQVTGPFRSWEHTHLFDPDPDNPNTCLMTDHIRFELPGGRLGSLLGRRFAFDELNTLFAWRHAVVAHDTAARSLFKEQDMKILISGSTGLIGSALVPLLTSGGHEVTRLVRHKRNPADPSVEWHPGKGELDDAALEGFDAVVHLAGENINGRWSPEKKERIRESRVRGTRLLCETLARLERPPAVLVCASAAGYYGNRADEPLSEETTPGKGFLADVCRQWEASTEPAARQGIRVVNARFAMVLSPQGGALPEMLRFFRLGLGGRLGAGDQIMSWVAIEDAIHAIDHALAHDTVRGPVNVCSPHPVTNREFTRVLAETINRPALFPAPAFALRLLYGDMADELLLTSQRMVPERLQATGYRFLYPELAGALRHVLGK